MSFRMIHSCTLLIIAFAIKHCSVEAFQMDNLKNGQAWTIGEGVKFSTLDKLTLTDTAEDNVMNIKKQMNKNSEKETVTVATKAVGLNFADIFSVLNLYSAANEVRGKQKTAFIPGLEFSGVVVNDPSGNYGKGERVLGFSRFGAYSDIVNVPPTFLKRLPVNWSFAEGASFLVQALTAWHGLVEIGRMPVVTEDDKPFIVIVHSAAGGVGLWASEIAARRGGTVIGIVGNEAKEVVFHDRIKALSPKSQTMIRGKESDFKKRLAEKIQSVHSTFNIDTEVNFENDNSDLKTMAKNSRGADIVMESLGGKYFTASFDSLNSGGALVTFGSTSYVTPGLGLNMFRLIYRYLTRPRIDPGVLTSRNIRLCGFNLIYLTERTADLRRELNECVACLSGLDMYEGKDEMTMELVLPPIIGETFDFRTEAVDAMEMLKSGKTVGKVVLDNSNNPCCVD